MGKRTLRLGLLHRPALLRGQLIARRRVRVAEENLLPTFKSFRIAQTRHLVQNAVESAQIALAVVEYFEQSHALVLSDGRGVLAVLRVSPEPLAHELRVRLALAGFAEALVDFACYCARHLG